jgi:hypothetical protein
VTGILNDTAREIPLEEGGIVEITRTSGDVRVRGVDGDRVVVRSRDGGPLGDDLVVDASPGTVRIRDGQVGLRIGPLSVTTGRSRDLDIDVPRSARVQLRTASGDVEAAGIGGASRWASASGDLRIATEGGAVQLETMSGDAILDAIGSLDLGARTVSGDLRVRASRLATTDVATTSGDIRLEADLVPGGRHAISSVSGDVELVTPSPVRVDVATIAGDVRAPGASRVEGSRGHRTAVVGSGSVGVSVRTTSGDVTLRVVGATSAPVAPGPDPAGAAGTSPADAPQPDPEPAPVAEAVAGPIGPRPITDEDTQAWSTPAPAADPRQQEQLDVLRALERGELDIETASRRLEHIDAAGPDGGRELG